MLTYFSLSNSTSALQLYRSEHAQVMSNGICCSDPSGEHDKLQKFASAKYTKLEHIIAVKVYQRLANFERELHPLIHISTQSSLQGTDPNSCWEVQWLAAF